MRKFTLLLSLAFIIVMSTEVNARQWSNTGNNLTTGTLRVGATIPFSTKKLIVRANGSDAVTLFDNISTFGTGLIVSAGQDVLRLGSLNNQLGNVMLVKADGRVGIGTTSPLSGYKLDVNGKVNMDGFYSTATNNYINGNLTVYGYVSDWSDRRFKKNIKEEFSEYQKLYDLKIYEYQYKDRDDRQSFGVMAQELTEVFPDLVLGNDEDGYSVRYTSMIPLLIRAVQDQKQTIESLKEELTELKAKITDNTELAEVLGIEGERMTIFPNPSSRVANITLKGNTRGNISLEVVNLNGEVVQRVAGNGSKSAEINTSDMLKGVYFVRYLRDGKVVETKRLLIEK